MAVITPFLAHFQFLRGYVGSLAWMPLVQLSRSAILSLLTRIEAGKLELQDADGHLIECGSDEEGGGLPRTSLRVHKDTFWVRLLLFADMGFAESYMLGEVSCSDLTAFFKIFILNKDRLFNGQTITSAFSSTVSGLARQTNTLTNSRLNISAHYDISNAMFAAFLSPDMTYSCPIWQSRSSPMHRRETLKDAQVRKLDRFIRRAHIKASDHVLEIGTGWGSFAIQAVRETGCRVTSLTLSTEQKALAEERIEQAGLQSRIEVLLCDYRALEKERKGVKYDKLVSIEMLEAVGKEFLETYFGCVDRLLKKEGGVAVFQCITIPETRYEAYAKGNDFIRKYIFPGGHLPSVSQLVSSIASGSKGTLVVDSIEDIGPHYAKTLRIWRESFMGNFDSDIRPALLREHANMTKADVETFRQKWEYYFTYCEAGFATKTLGDIIFTVGREGALEMLEDVPL